ncbi:hypothetical protein [Nocardiopsis trehalosi]|uniref:hypothetical protein n=1 Tax=Nocardiopsis trehalosi TaxID=109329 RepID=UPI0008371F1F|nr:hypothetical protein [Nocardiopsis trehalosi]
MSDAVRWEDLDDDVLLDLVLDMMDRHPEAPPIARLRQALTDDEDLAPPQRRRCLTPPPPGAVRTLRLTRPRPRRDAVAPPSR